MATNQVSVTGMTGIVATLHRVQSIIQTAQREKRDLRPVIRESAQLLDQIAGTVDAMRVFAPGLGSLWDTLRTVIVAIEDILNLISPPAGEGVSDV